MARRKRTKADALETAVTRAMWAISDNCDQGMDFREFAHEGVVKVVAKMANRLHLDQAVLEHDIREERYRLRQSEESSA